jgi:hypothetical protein
MPSLARDATTRDLVRRPRTRHEQAAEQDLAAGGPEQRMLMHGATKAKGAIYLSRKGDRVVAALFYKAHGRDFRRQVGLVSASSRAEALKQAWDSARRKGLAGAPDP